MEYNVLKGMKDRYFSDSEKHNFILKVAKDVFEKYGYKNIITPIVEETELFKRSVGDETDVVSKEMYTFEDKGGRNITLRPEGTAGVVRAYLNAGLHKSNPNIKWYYSGPMYRYEAPQKGRYREFYQIGVESFGVRNPMLDAEIIAMAVEFLSKLGLNNLTVELNSLGSVECRVKYIKDLQDYLLANIDKLSDDSKIRASKNPLRVLDSKSDEDQKLLVNAPKLHEYFDEESNKFFEELKNTLTSFGIKYVINPKLVRGLDYYSDTVFEIKSENLGAQSTVLGGGRYDKLTEILAGVKVPGIGFAAGIERITLLLDENLITQKEKLSYIVYFDETKEYMLNVLKVLREEGIRVEFDYSPKGFGGQMKKANKLGALYAIILGEDEKNKGMITLKNLETGNQEELTLSSLIERIK